VDETEVVVNRRQAEADEAAKQQQQTMSQLLEVLCTVLYHCTAAVRSLRLM
jgi:hypothetical protein